MPAPQPSFRPSYDIHLLRGQSIELSDLLEIDNTDLSRFINANANITCQFKTSFNASAKLKITGTVGNAASRTPTYTIKVEKKPPSDPKYLITSFLVYAIVTDTDDSSTSETAIRIHVHTSIQQVWMTPDPLTVYQGADYVKCSVYALFDDGEVAEIGDIYDIYYNAPVGYDITKKVQITWKSTTRGLIETYGAITPGTRTGDHNVKITVKYNGKTVRATGTIRISDMLSAGQTAIQAKQITTGQCPGFSKLNEIPNVLFVSEGFRDLKIEKDAFDQIVDNYVSDLVSKKITAPFDKLAGSINFWSVFVPSRENGITHRGVLELYDTANLPMKGFSVIGAFKPDTDDASGWMIEDLQYYVGGPVKSDETIQNDQLRLRWENTTRLTSAQLDVLFGSDNSPVDRWKSSANQRLPDAKDSAFGIIVNDYTAITPAHDYNKIDFDKRRVQRMFLDGFLGSLKNENNDLIGSVFVMNSATGQRAKDYDNIIFLLADGRARFLNADGFMFSGLESYDEILLSGTITDARVSVLPINLPTKLSIFEKGTLTHELAHSLGLQDEYGESGLDSGEITTDPVVASWPFANFSKPAYLTDSSSNVQAKKDLERPSTGGGTEIDAYKIKWRYPRILKGSLVTTISLSGTDVVMTVKNPEVGFSTGEMVFFRKRRVNQSQLCVSNVGVSVIAGIVRPTTFTEDFTDYLVTVKAVDPANNQITIESDGTDVQTTIELVPGYTGFFKIGDSLSVDKRWFTDPIHTVLRAPASTAGQPDLLTPAVSPELKVKSMTGNQITVEVVGTASLPAGLASLSTGEEMLLYAPVPAPDAHRSTQYPYAELIAKPVLDHLNTNAYPLNANTAHQEIIDNKEIQNSSLPMLLVPCWRRKKEIIGLYSGGMQYHGNIYHPAAKCLMRGHTSAALKDRYTELCAVCRYTLINLIDPTKFGDFDDDYMKRKIYPE